MAENGDYISFTSVIYKSVFLLLSLSRYACAQNTAAAVSQSLLVVDAHHVIKTDSVGGVMKNLLTNENIGDIDYDDTTGFLYWSNRQDMKIQKVFILSERAPAMEIQDVVTSDVNYPGGIVGDWKNQMLYWTDLGVKTIESVNLVGDCCRDILVNRDLVTPRSLTMDTATASLFWIDQGVYSITDDGETLWTDAKIEKFDLDLNARTTLRSLALPHPTSIFYSMERERLFWSDDVTKIIYSCSVTSCDWTITPEVKSNTVYDDNHPALNKPSGVVVINNILYWTERDLNTVMMKNMTSRVISRVPGDLFVRPTSVHAFNSRLPTGLDPCDLNNGGCEQFCTFDAGSVSCSCYDGYLQSSTDNQKCIDIDECLNGGAMCSGMFEMCTNSPGSHRCECMTGYARDDVTGSCTDIDECSEGISDCHQLCENTAGSYSCSCMPGYDQSNQTCRDVNECAFTLCYGPGCTNTPGSFYCGCDQGFTYHNGSCVKQTCEEELPVLDGYIIQCGMIEGTGRVCHLLCRQGRIHFRQDITCSEDGKWIFPDTVCSLDELTGPMLSIWPPGVEENVFRGTKIGILTLLEGNRTIEIQSCMVRGSMFIVQKVNGEWTVKVEDDEIDYEVTSELSLFIRVTTASGDFQITLIIDVYDVNEALDTITLSRQRILENRPVGRIVDRLESNDPDRGQIISYYKINETDSSGQYSNKLRIESDSLIINQKMNFEMSPYYIITIKGVDNGYPQLSSTQAFRIDVIDINEAPSGLTITNNIVDEYTDELLTNTKTGFVIGTIRIQDEDDPRTENYSIAIESTNFQTKVCFEVRESGRDSAGHELFELLVGDEKCFDYERYHNQTAYIMIKDDDVTSYSHTIVVTIRDVNEPPNRIVFGGHSVLEHTPNGTRIGDVVAADPDSSPDRIMLTVTSQGDLVRLVTTPGRGETGQSIVVNADYDYETMTQFVFTVRATDIDTMLFNERDFTINILNEPNEPEITMSVVEEYRCRDASPFQICINEDSTTSVPVATFHVLLPGGGSSYYLELEDITGKFQLQEHDLVLMFNLNYERMDSISVHVTATDHNQLWSIFPVTIQVLDVNEGPIQVKLNNTIIPNQARPETVIGTLTCVDEDSDDSYEFDLLQTSRANFYIDGNLLKVGYRDLVDIEYSLTIRCNDRSGLNVASSFVLEYDTGQLGDVTVTLEGDLVLENAADGTNIGNVTATIDGLSHDDVINFEFKLENEANIPFSLRPLSNDLAALYKNGLIDYEVNPSFDLVIKVTDIMHGSEVKFVPFTIRVLDFHEAPSSLALSRYSIPEGSAGHDVTIVAVIDPEPEAVYTFELVRPLVTPRPGTKETLTSKLGIKPLDNFQAMLYSVAEIDYETLRHTQQQITLRYTDVTVPTITGEMTFNMTILNVNEAPTDIQLQNGEAQIREDVTVGSIVDRVIVIDPDDDYYDTNNNQDDAAAAGHAADFTCDIITDFRGWFEIDTDLNLIVSRDADVDYELLARHVGVTQGPVTTDVTLECFDSRGLSVQKSLEISIVDVNEAPSYVIVQQRDYNTSLEENQPTIAREKFEWSHQQVVTEINLVIRGLRFWLNRKGKTTN